MSVALISVCSITLVVVGVIQLLVVAEYVRAQCRAANRLLDPEARRENFEPPTNVVLCLRGADPFLSECISRLLAQNYSDFQLYCVLDREDDPAARIVDEFVSDPRLHRIVVAERLNSCGLKNNSLLTAIANFQRQPQVVVSVDADALVDPNWLLDLVSPLKDEQTVACSGTRWFSHADQLMGSQVRHLWQLAAAPQMRTYGVLWGGSLAMKFDFARLQVAPVWKVSLFDDVMIGGLAKKIGKKAVVLPEVIVVNRERARLKDVQRWMTRQLLDTRLYLKQFSLIFGHSVLVPLLVLIQLGVYALSPIVSADSELPVLWPTIGLLAYLVSYLLCWTMLHRGAATAISARQLPQAKVPKLWQFPIVAVFVTQWTYLVAAVGAVLKKKVVWRGVDYRVKRHDKIRLLEYKPFVETNDSRESL